MSSRILRSSSLVAGICLAASTLAHAELQVAAGTPQGVMAAQLPVGKHAIAVPLLGQELWLGNVTGNFDNAITVSGAPVTAALQSGGQYYIEILSGPLEGERFDLNAPATLAGNGGTVRISLAATSFSTRLALPTDALASARAAIRSHVTLATLQSMFSPALVGNNSAALADSVMILRDGILYTYYLRADGISWRESGKGAEERTKVIPPDSSLLVQLRSGAKRWVQLGDVRTNAFRLRLAAGTRAVASGYPVSLSPVEFGAFVDPALPAGQRWVGNDAGSADTIQVFDAATGAFKTYYLRADGSSWYPAGGSGDQSVSPLFAPTGMVVIKRTNPDADYVVVPPFAL